MTTFKAVFLQLIATLIFVLLCPLFSQNAIRAQFPIVTENLLPSDAAGVGVEYEKNLSGARSILLKGKWFKEYVDTSGLEKDPNFPAETQLRDAANDYEGYAVSLEVRHYFNEQNSGWHIGPYTEFALYKFISKENEYFGDGYKNNINIGAVGGFKKDLKKITTDISYRVGWYSGTEKKLTGYFPEDSSFHSLFLISLGYKFN